MSSHETAGDFANVGVVVQGGTVPYAHANAPPAPIARAPRGHFAMLLVTLALAVLVLIGDAVALGVSTWARSGGYGFHFGPFQGNEEGEHFTFLSCKSSDSWSARVCGCCHYVGIRVAPLLIIASVLHFFGVLVLVMVTVFHKHMGRVNSALRAVPILAPVLFALSAVFFFVTPIVFATAAMSDQTSCQATRNTYGMNINGGGFVVACVLAVLSPILFAISTYAVVRLRSFHKQSGQRDAQWRAPFGDVSDAELGVTACCCPAYLYGTTRHRWKGESMPEEACKYALLQCFCSSCLLGGPARGEMRAQLTIDGDACNDCLVHTFCSSCALVQERMEIDARLRDGSLTMPNSVTMVRPAQQSLLAGAQGPPQQQQQQYQQQQQQQQYQQQYQQQQGLHYVQPRVMDIPGRIIATAEQRAEAAAAAAKQQEQEEESA